MRLPLTRSESIELTIIITHLTLSHLWLLLLVRLGGYIVNLWHFYSYRLIGKLIAFLQLHGAPIASKTHTHPSHSHTSRLLTLSYLITQRFKKKFLYLGKYSKENCSPVFLPITCLWIDYWTVGLRSLPVRFMTRLNNRHWGLGPSGMT